MRVKIFGREKVTVIVQLSRDFWMTHPSSNAKSSGILIGYGPRRKRPHQTVLRSFRKCNLYHPRAENRDQKWDSTEATAPNCLGFP